MKKQTFLLIILLLNGLFSHPQTIIQTLKGTVTDKETGMPLPGANILVMNSSPPNGTSTDSNGKFRLLVQVGRISPFFLQ